MSRKLMGHPRPTRAVPPPTTCKKHQPNPKLRTRANLALSKPFFGFVDKGQEKIQQHKTKDTTSKVCEDFDKRPNTYHVVTPLYNTAFSQQTVVYIYTKMLHSRLRMRTGMHIRFIMRVRTRHVTSQSRRVFFLL